MTITAPVHGDLVDPTWAQQITDAVNALNARLVPLVARKSADQSLATNSTTLQNVTGLVVAVTANTTYDGALIIAAANSSGTTEDVKYGFTFPSGATFDFFGVGPSTAITASNGDGEWGTQIGATSGVTTRSFGAVAGGVYTNTLLLFRLAVASTAGNLQVQAAQATSGANTITIRLGSKMTLWQTSS